jgi:hypothetical protein
MNTTLYASNAKWLKMHAMISFIETKYWLSQHDRFLKYLLLYFFPSVDDLISTK